MTGSNSAPKSLPQGRLGRFVKYAGLGARTGASLLLSRDAKAAAAHAAEVLGTMRGLAAKIGQMASYVDGVVPEAQREVYEKALRSLRTAAPTSSPEAIRHAVEEDLGAPIDRLFAEWETEPFASASIGQVHRATLEDGRRVAVKVQHPGIAKAVESDLANAGVLQSMAGAFMPKNVNPKEMFAEIKERFREELDYRLEAERQGYFRELHRGDPHIRIPEVVAERSSMRVLTTLLASGKTLDEAAEGDEAQRRHHAEVLWRFVFKGNLVGGLFNADPHPGNYLFADDGTITFLDFGCCQPISGARHEHAIGMHRAAVMGDESGFRAAVARMLETEGGSYEKTATKYTRRCFEPLFRTPYLVERAYVKDLVDGVMDMKQEVFAKDGSFRPMPRGILFMNRLQFGFYSVLARLRVEADYVGIERAFLEEAKLL